MFRDSQFPRVVALILTGLSVLSFPVVSVSQQIPKGGEDPAILRWKIVLGSLAQESRTVFPEDRRPYAMVEVANAYWEVDRDAARQLLVSALDRALSLTRQDKKLRSLVNHVLSSAAGRDAALAKELNKRLLDEEGDKDDISAATALDMLEENPEAAAQLAEAFAPNGLQDGTAAFLIFSLAQKDTRLSNRVYGVYLNKVGANESIPLESVLTLAGYALGYSEYYSVTRRGDLMGSSFPPIAGLAANPAFTGAFLNLASLRLAQAIERRNRATGAEIEALNYPILFASEYLLPEVSRYAPASMPSWQQLQQQGIVGVTTQQTQHVQNHMLVIQRARLRLQQFSDSSQTPELEAEASLENVEKLTGTCQRDVVYSKAALLYSSRKNFKRALELAEKLEDLKQSGSVKEAITIQKAEVAIENGEFDEAQTIADKISSIEHRARLYVMLAQAMYAKEDRQQAQVTINEAVKLTEKFSDPGDRAAFRFSISTLLLKTDPGEAQTVMRIGVASLNKKEPSDLRRFVIPIKVPLSCPGEEVSWYGGFETIPNSSVFDALVLLAKHNPDAAERTADEIGDKITRIRAHALITKLVLQKLVEAEIKAKSNRSGVRK
jgi:tetratricopeptide (TPR) repeat protein